MKAKTRKPENLSNSIREQIPKLENELISSQSFPVYNDGLYNPDNEHDACGVGMIVNLNGNKSHELVDSALRVLENMKHRGAEGAEPVEHPALRTGNAGLHRSRRAQSLV